jgi:hypothetical protein
MTSNTTRRALLPTVMLFAIVLGFAPSLFAQTVTPGPDGVLSISAAGAPLSAVLDAVAQVAPFDALTVAPSMRLKAVTVDVRNLSPRAALISVLDAAGVDYGLSASSTTGRMRLAVIASAGPAVAPTAAVAEPQVDAPAPVEQGMGVSPNPNNPYSHDEPFVPDQVMDPPAWASDAPATPAETSAAPAPGIAQSSGEPTPAGTVGTIPAPAKAAPASTPGQTPVRKVGG